MARAIALLALLSGAGCQTTLPPRALPAETAGRLAGAYEAERAKAWAPRRWKALYSGEVSPRIGAILRGYLALYWDGATLTWKASAPIAGSVRGGTIRTGTATGGSGGGLLPGLFEADDVLGAVLGVPARPGLFGAAVEAGELVKVPLDGGGRSVLLDREGRVVAQELPGGVEVKLEPGTALPRRITLKGKEGRAELALQSYAPWPEGEPLPGGGP